MEEGEGKGWRARRPFFLPSLPLLLLLLLLEIRLIFPAFSSGRNVNEITRRKLSRGSRVIKFISPFSSQTRKIGSGDLSVPFFLALLNDAATEYGPSPFPSFPLFPSPFFPSTTRRDKFPRFLPEEGPPPSETARTRERQRDR